MTTVHKTARELRPGDIVIAYPDPDHGDRYGQPGRWTVTEPDERHERYVGDRVRVEYDGGMWALHPDQPVLVRPIVRERQQAAVTALADLLTRDLPPLRWHIHPHAVGGLLDAQPNSVDDMDAWARTLGAEIVTKVYADYISHTIDAEHMGVGVLIYEQTDVAYKYVRTSTKADQAKEAAS